MKIIRFLTVVGAGLMALCYNGQAALLNINPDPNAPDFGAGSINVSYDAGTRIFTAAGKTTTYKNPYSGGNLLLTPYYPNSFQLSATIDNSGSVSAGTIKITGKIGAMTTPDTLLQADLLPGIGYADPITPSNEQFDFTFSNITGNVAAEFLQWGSVGGINLFTGSMTGTGAVPFADWNHSFNNGTSGNGFANTFVPEPACYPVCTLGLAALTLFLPRLKFGKSAPATF